MSSAEFVEWRAFQLLEGPLSPWREDWRMAMLASVIANGNRDPKRYPRPFEEKDFIPEWAVVQGIEKPRLGPREVADKVKGLFANLIRRGGRQ
jgi:hypothetical protein